LNPHLTQASPLSTSRSTWQEPLSRLLSAGWLLSDRDISVTPYD
jgi:hypothetical protein